MIEIPTFLFLLFDLFTNVHKTQKLIENVTQCTKLPH